MAVKTISLRISDAEHRGRCDVLLNHVREAGLSGVVLFDADYIKYYTGFAFIPTERPMAFAMNAKGERGLFVPRLEKEHAEANALIEFVSHYPEYPGTDRPESFLVTMLQEMGISKDIGADSDGYPWIFGYRGEALSKLTGAAVTQVRGWIEDQMAIKSAAEIALLVESCVWANLAHVLLQRYTRPGVTETDVSTRASDEATRAMLDAIGPIYRGQSSYYGGAMAGYRGQIGRNAAIPHALANNMTFQDGDVLVTGASAPVWGYVSELERTMIIGKPSDEQKRMFDHMVALQDLANATIQPGVPCSEVDKTLRKYYAAHDLTQYWKHHVGHCIGLRYHEGPFLDTGDNTIIQPGMVFTVEPGLYKAGLGGCRHSDTVVVTADGVEMITYYPRDLESLTLPS
ncbi:MAG: aminopeptidase P family protein [Chloroflexi bacterium]|nr:aminopeptidase P family protein [Chloroflexota bacterium]